MATASGKRAFWMHQIAEYVIAAMFVAQGLQSNEPAIPAIAGGLVLLNAACAKGPAAAFRLFGRRVHKVLDLVLIATITVVAVQPVVSIENRTRLVMGALAFVLGFVWLGSDFGESVPRRSKSVTPAADRVTSSATSTSSTSAGARRPAPAGNGSRAEDLGRTAGRLAGKGVNIYRDQAAKRRKK